MNISSLSTELELSVNLHTFLSGERKWIFRNDRSINNLINRYKKFLMLIQKYPEQIFIPTVDIDECWHAHLQSPVAYYNDCMQLFGKILDHHAGFGREKHERKEWKMLFKKTSLLWMEEYNEPYSTGFFNRGKVCSDCKSKLTDITPLRNQ